MTETPTPQNPFVIQFEENFHNPEWLKENHIKKIMGQWVYDVNKIVHCCEVTPSYELNFVRYEVIYEDGFEPTDKHKEKIEDEIQLSIEPFIYIHCSVIDKITLIESLAYCNHNEPWRLKWLSDAEIETLDPDEDYIADTVEYLNANHF